MPLFSVVLPTYNRADTVLRSIASVRAQTCGDFELVLVDDGSTDGTRDVLPKDEPRLRVFSQPNGGVAKARNRGITESRGDFIAFLDSDDEWPPHTLALAAAFFAAHPDERLFTGEMWQDWGHGVVERHFRVEQESWFPAVAERIGSRAFAGGPPQGDPYLWAYETREPIGEWGRAIAERAGHAGAMLYRGDVSRAWRWGWLMCMQATIQRRSAVEAIGPLDESYPIASDYAWLARACRLSRANTVSLPLVIKHELTQAGGALREGHLVYGRSALAYQLDRIRGLEEMFLRESPDDPELLALRANRQLEAARAAVRLGDRAAAAELLREARKLDRSADAAALALLVKAAPGARAMQAAYRGWSWGRSVPGKLRARLGRVVRS